MIATTKIHEGHNVKRIREILGIKQDALAFDLNLSQQAISQLEQKESIDPALLEEISKVLKVPVEAIKNFDEEAAINIISNTFNDESFSHNIFSPLQCTFNPVDKWLEVLDENKKLYERLVQVEREKNDLLQKILDRK